MEEGPDLAYLRRVSVAFTKEQDAESAAADLPDRPISPHPNLVTAEGLALLEASLAAARAAYTAARGAGDIGADRTAMARATRDLRYYVARRANAQLVGAALDNEAVRFGATVEILRPDGRLQTFRIVGEDEAEPASGSISYVSPLAKALLGKGVGDGARLMGEEIEVISIR